MTNLVDTMTPYITNTFAARTFDESTNQINKLVVKIFNPNTSFKVYT